MAREALAATTELQRALAEDPHDIAKCRDIAARIGELRQQELVRLVHSIAEVRAKLTDEQRAVLQRLQ